jgi:hypothetical protein
MSDCSDQSELDQAVARRLARLREAPVELSRLKAGLAAALAGRSSARRRANWQIGAFVAAAAIGMAVGIAILLALASRPHTLSVAELTQLSAENGPLAMNAMPAASIDEAARMIRTQWATALSFTGVNPTVRACCFREICGRQLACMSLRGERGGLTLAVCRTSQLDVPAWDQRTVNGVRCGCYTAPTGSNGINVVARKENGLLILALGRQDVNVLLNTVANVQLQGEPKL